MKKQTIRRLAWVSGGVILLMIVLFAARFIILKRIEQKVVEQLQALRDSGYIVRYDSININTRENTVAIFRLAVKRGVDTTVCSTTDFLSAKYIQADGFRMMPLLFKRRLSFSSIRLDSPKFTLNQNFFSDSKDQTGERREFSIMIDELLLPNASFVYYDSTECEPNLSYHSNLFVKEFFLSFEEDQPPAYDLQSFVADHIDVSLPKKYYSVKIATVQLDKAEGTFSLDTMQIIPHLDKVSFGRKVGKEIDHIEATIPYINFYGLKIDKGDSAAIAAEKMTVQFFCKIFRDKRLPFKNDFKTLPVEGLHGLPIALNLDSIIVNKSYVRYEEFGEDADSSGHVVFDNLYATVKNVNNVKRGNSATMIAESDFMQGGKIRLKATFPKSPNGDYTVNGSLNNLELNQLNSMLEPQARLRVESGYLNKLTFGFRYNNDVSNGELKMNYRDLKVVTFRTDEKTAKRNARRKKRGKAVEEGVEKAPLKTFVLNTLVLKTNMDGDTPEEKRNGTIHFERDKRKSIFNFWSKSMLSGIKNLYKLDKLEESKIKELLDGEDKE